jgi:transposase
MSKADAGAVKAVNEAMRQPLVALQQIYGVGPVVACHLLAEIGAARRFHRAQPSP